MKHIVEWFDYLSLVQWGMENAVSAQAAYKEASHFARFERRIERENRQSWEARMADYWGKSVVDKDAAAVGEYVSADTFAGILETLRDGSDRVRHALPRKWDGTLEENTRVADFEALRDWDTGIVLAWKRIV